LTNEHLEKPKNWYKHEPSGNCSF